MIEWGCEMKQYVKGLKSILVSAAILLLLNGVACTADCAWYDEASAWVDENQNGVWDPEEEPLAGVEFIIDDVRNKYQDVGDEAISNEEGKAQLSVWLPGCPSVEFEISAKPPEGFQPTTPDRVSVSRRAIRNPGKNVFTFGFASLTEK